jgi:hypothetical protein
MTRRAWCARVEFTDQVILIDRKKSVELLELTRHIYRTLNLPNRLRRTRSLEALWLLPAVGAGWAVLCLLTAVIGWVVSGALELDRN